MFRSHLALLALLSACATTSVADLSESADVIEVEYASGDALLHLSAEGAPSTALRVAWTLDLPGETYTVEGDADGAFDPAAGEAFAQAVPAELVGLALADLASRVDADPASPGEQAILASGWFLAELLGGGLDADAPVFHREGFAFYVYCMRACQKSGGSASACHDACSSFLE